MIVVPRAALLLGLAASCATYLGGRVALRSGRAYGSLLGLAAGMVIGVALFDLLPEALALGGGTLGAGTLVAVMGITLLLYTLLDRLASAPSGGPSRFRATIAPASLVLHSLADGTGIGLAFQLSDKAGWVVALAVVAHDLADGLNTVSLSLTTGSRRTARRWLWLNTVAPIGGVLVGSAVPIPAPLLGVALASFAGVLLCVGACHLLPRSHALRPWASTSLANIAGALFIWTVVRLAQ
jgi:ZIP family zinc transporter